MDILLSFIITIKSFFNSPALERASNAIPPVIAPSPITAITFPESLFNLFPSRIPRAAEIEVEAWPVLKAS